MRLVQKIEHWSDMGHSKFVLGFPYINMDTNMDMVHKEKPICISTKILNGYNANTEKINMDKV